MRKMLVTGGAGFIGANFCRYWTVNHPEDKIVVADALTYAGNRDAIRDLENSDTFVFVEGDICDESLMAEIFQRRRIDTAVHFAAESHVDISITSPDIFIKTNVTGTHTLLKLAKRFWSDCGDDSGEKRFHHVSTDEVYGSLAENDAPFSETTPYAPSSPYAASKAASDHLVRAYAHTYGLSATISNCSNNYGPHQDCKKLIPLLITNILHGKPLPIYGDGRNIRDWLYVEDHCRGIDLILTRGTPGETYNIGGETEKRNIEIASLLCDIIDARLMARRETAEKFPEALVHKGASSRELITFVEDRKGHDWRYAIDPGKAREQLGYRPLESFDAGIAKTVDWYLEML